jgi:hypothetical protein
MQRSRLETAIEAADRAGGGAPAQLTILQSMFPIGFRQTAER